MCSAAEGHDRAVILEVIERYFSAIDRRDPDRLQSCFAENAVMEFAVEGIALTGRGAIMSRLGGFSGGGLATHLRGNSWIEISGDEAHADTSAAAYLVEGLAGPGRMLVRGLRYVDRLVREDGAWRIVHRKHHSLWQFAAEPMSLRLYQAGR